MAAQPDLFTEALAAHARGWPLTPLSGKVPQLAAWTGQPAPEPETLRAWLSQSNVTGLGLRTGTVSGVFVLDRDTGASPLELPRTVAVATPSGGEHYYFRHPALAHPDLPRLGNSASRIAPHWDTRGDGGQVVYPGSRHPNGGVYQWLVHPDDAELAELPAELLAKLLDPAPRSAPHTTASNQYARAALVRESARVRNAPEGQRNDTLNGAAFNLGQLVAGGELAEHEVRAQLEADAELAGLTRSETARTVSSGLAAGMQHPRRAPERPDPGGRITIKAAEPVRGEPTVEEVILVPGAHVLPGQGDATRYVEVSPADFADTVFAALPDDVVYRRGGIPGEIVEDRFHELTTTRMRLHASRHIRFGRGIKPKKEDAPPTVVFQSLSADHAGLLAHAAQSDPRVRPLDFLTSFPICLPDWTISPPGYSQGVYYTGKPAPSPVRDHETIRSVLSDLVADFPFKTKADRQNFYGLLLTPIVRRAIGGPAPLHIVASGAPRTGKSKLIETAFGGVTLGRATPAFQLGRNEDEREKRIFSILLMGEQVLYLDNLNEKLDSASLASLLTANVYRGRILGSSSSPALPNSLTMVATANNATTSEEISKRVVPIELLTPPDPEARTDFRHPDLVAYVAEHRDHVRSCLYGMIANWLAAGRPRGPARPMGGYEGWSAVTGILAHHGLDQHLANAAEWRQDADDFPAQVAALVGAWAASTQLIRSTDELLDLASELGLFEAETQRESRQGAKVVFGRHVLSKLPERPCGEWRVRRGATNGRTLYRLELIEPTA